MRCEFQPATSFRQHCIRQNVLHMPADLSWQAAHTALQASDHINSTGPAPAKLAPFHVHSMVSRRQSLWDGHAHQHCFLVRVKGPAAGFAAAQAYAGAIERAVSRIRAEAHQVHALDVGCGAGLLVALTPRARADFAASIKKESSSRAWCE